MFCKKKIVGLNNAFGEGEVWWSTTYLEIQRIRKSAGELLLESPTFRDSYQDSPSHDKNSVSSPGYSAGLEVYIYIEAGRRRWSEGACCDSDGM